MWKAEIVRIGDLVSGNAQLDVRFYEEGTENQFTKSFSLDFMSINDSEQVLNLVRDQRDKLNALGYVLEALSPLVGQEIE